jgi:hypothetical protein
MKIALKEASSAKGGADLPSMASQGRKKRKAPRGSKGANGKRRKSVGIGSRASGSDPETEGRLTDDSDASDDDDDAKSSRRATSERQPSTVPSHADDDDDDLEDAPSPRSKQPRPRPKPRFKTKTAPSMWIAAVSAFSLAPCADFGVCASSSALAHLGRR